MSIEIFTKELVEQAHRGEGRFHPLVSVIALHAPRITQADSEMARKKALAALADGVEGSIPFSMGPLDLVVLWSEAEGRNLLQGNRRDLAIIIALSFAKQDLASPVWRGLPRYIVENDGLPEVVQSDREGLLHVQGRFNKIQESLNQLHLYVHGRPDAMEHAISLAPRIAAGDAAAKEEYEKLLARQKANQTPVLAEIDENFGTALHNLQLLISNSMDRYAGTGTL